MKMRCCPVTTYKYEVNVINLKENRNSHEEHEEHEERQKNKFFLRALRGE